MVFSFTLDFVAKTQRLEDPSYANTLEFPALRNFPFDGTERLLCPVRAMRHYLRRTRRYRTDVNTRLFLSFGRHKKEVSKSAISYWIRQVIIKAFRALPDSDFPLHKVNPQEVRAVATSLLFWKNLALRQVMEAARWRCNTTFVSFYLRSLSRQFRDTFRLGHLVVAQHTI